MWKAQKEIEVKIGEAQDFSKTDHSIAQLALEIHRARFDDTHDVYREFAQKFGQDMSTVGGLSKPTYVRYAETYKFLVLDCQNVGLRSSRSTSRTIQSTVGLCHPNQTNIIHEPSDSILAYWLSGELRSYEQSDETLTELGSFRSKMFRGRRTRSNRNHILQHFTWLLTANYSSPDLYSSNYYEHVKIFNRARGVDGCNTDGKITKEM